MGKKYITGSINIGDHNLDATMMAALNTVVANYSSYLTTMPAHNQAWSTITSTPTTLAGYGITDAAASNHGHNYLPLTGGTLSGSLDVNADIQGNTFSQAASGVPRNNLGAPTISEMALFDNQFSPKTTLANSYDDLTDLTFWVQTTSSSAWTEVTTYSDDQKRRFLRTNNSSVIIPNGAYKFRVEFVGRHYTFANAMYAYWSSNSHNTQVHIWKYNVANSAWTQHTSSSATVSSWPGHLYLPFGTIPWHESTTTSTGHFKSIRIEFTPNWSTGTYSDRNINLSGIQLWGGYPSGKRTVHSYDQNGKLNLYGNLYVPGDITVGGTVDGVDISALPTTFAPTTAEANVQADWNATSGDALILNKPAIPQGDITSVAAGDGLTGGGTSGAVTLNVVGGTGITANANDIAIDATVATLAGTQTFTGAKTINTLKIGTANKIQFGNNDFIRYDDANGVGRFHFDSDGGTNNSSVQAATFVGALSGNAATASSAAKWTTARTITLAGDLSGSVSIDGASNVTLTATIADDSHDLTWANIDGETANAVNSWGGLRHQTNDGYIDFGPANSSHAHIYTDRPNFYFNKELLVNNQRVFHVGYHPNADKWTTARTLTLTGDASGSVSWDGSANASLSVAVNNDSHYHSQIYIPDTRGAVRAPSYYPDRYTSFDFQHSADTGAGGDAWHALQTVSPWSTYNASHRQQQIAYTGSGGLKFRYATSETTWEAWQTLWTSGNDGSGSGLDADLLDGQQGSYYLSQGSTGLSGTNRISTSTDFNNSAPSGFYQGYNITNSPTGSTWYNMLNVRHSNTANDHGFQMAASYYNGNFYTRTYQGGSGANNGTYTTWAKQWSDSNDGAGSGLDADRLDGQEGAYYYPASNPSGYTTNAGDITSVAAGTNLNGGGTSGAVTLNLDTTVNLNILNIGQGAILQESTDRADLLQITSSTSSWAGLQIRNSSDEGRWSFMTDGSTAGFFDDQQNEWAVQMAENNAVRLYYNNSMKFTTNSTGIDVLGNININENIAHGGDSNTYIGFPSNDNFRIVTAGVERMKVNSSAVTISSLVPTKLVLNNTKNGTWTSGEALGLIDFYGNDASGGGAKIQSSIEVLAHDQYGAHFNMTFNLSNGSSGNSEKMRITGEGRIGIGTTAPLATLHIDNPQTANNNIGFVSDAAAGGLGTINMKVNLPNYGEGIRFIRTGTYNGGAMKFYSNTSQVGSVQVNSSSTSYNTTSDYRAKENVVPMENSINRLKELKPCKFNFIIEPENTVDGFIAHEAQEVVPEAVTGEKDELDYEGNPEYQGIDQSKIVPLLTSALQEAISKIEQLETRIQTLENN